MFVGQAFFSPADLGNTSFENGDVFWPSNRTGRSLFKSHLNSYAYLRNLIVSKKNKFDKIRDIKEKQKCQPSLKVSKSRKQTYFFSIFQKTSEKLLP